jgi:cell wall-associated NlpC family hydrolase
MRVIYRQFATASEAFHESEAVLVKRNTQASAATAKAAAAARAAEGYRQRIRQLVRAESRSHPFEAYGAMLSSDSRTDFTARASLLEVVASRRAAVLAEAAKARTTAAAAAAEARATAESAAKLTRELRVKRAELSERATQAAGLYRRLAAQERAARIAAERAAAARAAAQRAAAQRAAAQRAAAERASRTADRTDPAPTSAPVAKPPPPSVAPPAVPVSGRASIAVAEARRQIGKPYVWGATGPDSFDCSGLTGWSWRAAGVTLPRTSRQQYAAGVKVSRSALQPGDLVYFGSPIYHVAIYVGANTMISAPQPGDVVKYQSLGAFNDYAGATRPG